MLTFTFVNKWKEVSETEQKINNMHYDNLDIRFCPLEEMYIWHHRFFDVKVNGFNNLIMSMGLGSVVHYAWRLEFQARGAPHVHALIWLSNRLALDTIKKCMFATMPNDETPIFKNLVDGPMIHKCNIARCKKGIRTAKCRYGFPKIISDKTCLNAEGEIIYARNQNETNIVEYSPMFLLKWGGHCHLHILRTEEYPDCNPNAIYYIVKYNFKSEPSLRIQMDNGSNNFHTAFNGRVISAEEAISKIFSFEYFGSDTSCEYFSLKPPESRKAAFINGRQVQITNIDKYFARPKELD